MKDKWALAFAIGLLQASDEGHKLFYYLDEGGELQEMRLPEALEILREMFNGQTTSD